MASVEGGEQTFSNRNYLKFEELRPYFHNSNKHSSNDQTSLSAMCSLCKQSVSYTNRTSHNLKRHLQTHHPNEKQPVFAKKRKLECDSPKSPMSPRELFFQRRISQNDLEKLIVEFVVGAMTAYSLIEDPAYTQLIKGLTTDRPDLKLPDRKKVSALVKTELVKVKETMRNILNTIQYVALAADLWSGSKRSFLGVSIHFIDPNTLERKYYLLSCKRLKGTHDFEKIAEALSSIIKEFDIHEKVVAVVTDNASNFAKAFRIYATHEVESESESSDAEEIHCDFELQSECLENILQEDMCAIELPPHYRCASHTLSLIASKDIDFVTDTRFTRKYKFGSVLMKKEFLLAAASHPKYQGAWIKNPEKEQSVAKLLKEEFESIYRATDSSPNDATATQVTTSDDLFDFDTLAASSSRATVTELDRFNALPSTDLLQLNELPVIKQIFLKYNTPVPSSGTLERAFCAAGRYLSKQRGRLSDSSFEALMILKFFKD